MKKEGECCIIIRSQAVVLRSEKSCLGVNKKPFDIENLVLAGLQTEYCIDASCKSAFEKGYSILIPQNGTSTFHHDTLSAKVLLDFYENEIWANRFAEVLFMEDLICRMVER